MPSGALWLVLGLCLFSAGAWGQENEDIGYKVSISGTRVVLTCPEDPESEKITWKKNNKAIDDENEVRLVLDNFSEVEDSGYFTCHPKDSHSLYLRARVCENCMEVDLTVVVTIVIVDVCVTLGLLLLVYYWSKKRKAKTKPVTRGVGTGGRPRGQNKEKPPPVPNPDYEPIRKGQRDLYAGLNQQGI
ncbi:T-cell surface glycoprotein CD3 epsilon chain isoform X2 [Choloepus didactylus]|uniref:T-cell surface glycoprotein CD3 epsilon chain isoform X2 n=1 Tax=Choloepus didactylus TaxID=27675 RepID=UPI00189D1176|nr:T-cell surface glycoprotein CD3 epsilon chain isoform X2 [Choloepus didactylus]XP_037697555.1 T-cell surface glycoprotein CD3 epsilon chain isoform X2 [Choloepus didactylus]